MTLLGLAEGVAGGLLLFFLPGYAVTKALFPEWRVRGPEGGRRLLETVTLSFVTSVGLTVVVGFGILDLVPGGFAATWSDPVLEGALAAVALVGFVAAFFRGAFARTPPATRACNGGGGRGGSVGTLARARTARKGRTAAPARPPGLGQSPAEVDSSHRGAPVGEGRARRSPTEAGGRICLLRRPVEALDYKMVLVVRGELRLTAGKAAVQVAHAAVLLTQDAAKRAPEALRAWSATGQKKIAVVASTLEELETLAREARALGILWVLVEDAGFTEVPPGDQDLPRDRPRSELPTGPDHGVAPPPLDRSDSRAVSTRRTKLITV